MTMRVWGLAAACAAALWFSGPAVAEDQNVDPAVLRSALDHLQGMLDKATKEEERQEQYAKVTVDALLYSASANQDRGGKPVAGRKFDVVGKLVIYTRPGQERYTLEGSNPWHPGVLRLDKLSAQERSEIDDQCSPTPCSARLLVTVLPSIRGEGTVGPAILQVDGFR